jgi:hypothetical protein
MERPSENSTSTYPAQKLTAYQEAPSIVSNPATMVACAERNDFDWESWDD